MENFTIGATTWPGLAKTAEECAELIHVIACLIAFPDGDRPDEDTPLNERLIEEMGDVLAAMSYAIAVNEPDISHEAVRTRAQEKLKLFLAWHDKERDEL